MALKSKVVFQGFSEACRKLGTHTWKGEEVAYSPAAVRHVLKGRVKNERMLELVAAKAPELFKEYPVAPEVKEWYRAHRPEGSSARTGDGSGIARGVAIKVKAKAKV